MPLKPYYGPHAGITIYHGDAREIMPGLAGTVISDPPYNIGYQYESWSDELPAEEYAAMIAITVRSPSVVIHLPEDMFTVSGCLRQIPSKVVAWIYNAHVGDSWRSIAWFGVTPDFTKERREYVNQDDKRVRALMETKPGGGPRIRDWWHIEQVKGNAIEKFPQHHCQIPEAVMRRILKITPVEEVILDPFMGTGTTLNVAKSMGQRAIGIDICESYCEIAAKRLSQEVLF